MVAQSNVFRPGQRVMVYDYSLFKDDVKTPFIQLFRPATVVCWYGKPEVHYPVCDLKLGPYPNLVDVIFDHRPNQVSHGHFGDGVETWESLNDPNRASKWASRELLTQVKLLAKARL